MGYVAPHLRNTAWYLFNELFMVRVNPTKIRSIEEIKEYGTPTTGNEDVDREMAKNEDLVMISIAQMEDIYNQGYPVKIVKVEDTKQIYNLIVKHLVAMKNIMTMSENFTNDEKTLDELIRLDQFASTIFSHARFFLKEDVPQSALAARMRPTRFAGLGRLGRSNQTAQGGPQAPVVAGKGSGSLRDYSTGTDVKENDPAFTPMPAVQSDPHAIDQLPEDPNLPKRISLEQMFASQKRMGLNWGG